jgi:hypothetical protein
VAATVEGTGVVARGAGLVVARGVGVTVAARGVKGVEREVAAREVARVEGVAEVVRAAVMVAVVRVRYRADKAVAQEEETVMEARMVAREARMVAREAERAAMARMAVPGVMKHQVCRSAGCLQTATPLGPPKPRTRHQRQARTQSTWPQMLPTWLSRRG